jgi:sugar/nucleoside kinase (ribokinase family)/phosphoglycolate phosphatase-like HAD superfamily hydrolase
VRKVGSARCSLGGAGNVVANLTALSCREVRALGVVGDDLYGRELRRLAEAVGADAQFLITQARDWTTPTYCKPFRNDEEQERLDFGGRNSLSPESAAALRGALQATLAQTDALIINQQLPRTLWTPEMIAALNAAAAKHPHVFVVADTRDLGDVFTSAALKLNVAGAAKLLGEPLPAADAAPLETAWRSAEAVFRRTRRPVLLTRGERGSLLYTEEGAAVQPGLLLYGGCDPVGAGDTFLAALAVARAGNTTLEEAADVAGFAAAVTVQKLRTTGTATPAEILAVGRDPNYVFRPETAEDPRRARLLPESEIELVNEKVPSGRVRHAVFDWDGTVSTLRQGWEEVMEPMMLRAVLGAQHDTAGEAIYHQVRRRVRDLIDQTTGVQTIVQMELLVALVREFGFVPRAEIRDRAGYKALYNEALLKTVRGRLEKLKRGELDSDDFTIKGAPEFLQALHARGVKLYLASGTDRDDVAAEVAALSCAEYFEGRVFGALANRRNCSKKMILDQIMKTHSLQGPEVAVFGDGPVEIREGNRRGGVAVGVASDEVRRYGLSLRKRERLIKAGADVVVPDFTQGARLLAFLWGEAPGIPRTVTNYA